jgi:hypothetical protein
MLSWCIRLHGASCKSQKSWRVKGKEAEEMFLCPFAFLGAGSDKRGLSCSTFSLHIGNSQKYC